VAINLPLTKEPVVIIPCRRAEHQMLNNIAKQDVVQIVGINYKDTKREGKYFLNTHIKPLRNCCLHYWYKYQKN
jgi:hypothetical protein